LPASARRASRSPLRSTHIARSSPEPSLHFSDECSRRASTRLQWGPSVIVHGCAGSKLHFVGWPMVDTRRRRRRCW
jgi:hypothetical protein